MESCSGRHATASARTPPRARSRWPGSAGASLLALDLVGLLAEGRACALRQLGDRPLPFGDRRRLLDVSRRSGLLLGGGHNRLTLTSSDVGTPDLADTRQALRRVDLEVWLVETGLDEGGAVFVDRDRARDAPGR